MSRKEYYKAWHQKNKNKEKQAMKKWYDNNKDHAKALMKAYKKNNSDKCNVSSAKYRASKLYATPKWLTPDQQKQIEEFYSICKEIQWLSNPCDPLEVDHIIPLQGENVCGLHVPWNLQILPRSQNLQKSNKV